MRMTTKTEMKTDPYGEFTLPTAVVDVGSSSHLPLVTGPADHYAEQASHLSQVSKVILASQILVATPVMVMIRLVGMC
jgi:hypothetical protein